MKFTSAVSLTAVVAHVIGASAYPGSGSGWAEKLREIQRRADAGETESGEDSNELLGDLLTIGAITPVGQTISDILLGTGVPESSEAYTTTVPKLKSDDCAKDTCCVWSYIAQDMKDKFTGKSGRCNLLARGAVRLGFHDAGTWKKGLTYGGADGSILLSNELTRPENSGLAEISAQMQKWLDKYSKYGISAADLIQMGATVATVACPLGPRIRSFVGRIDSSVPAVDGLLPSATADADSLIALFEDKTIRPHGLAALVGAHTTSQQRFFNTSRTLDPQDSTPGQWDVKFYKQTLNPSPPKRVLKFPSDVNLSVHPRIAKEWSEFADKNDGQKHWNEDFAREYIRLSMLGVFNINNLTECTKVLPAKIESFNPPDAKNLDKWVNGGFKKNGAKIAKKLDDGDNITDEALTADGVSPTEE